MLDDVVALAAEVIDAALAREYVAADADGVTIDHVAIEAVAATAGALDAAEKDPGAALLTLRAVLWLLAELPPVAGHGALQDALPARVRALAATGRCAR